MVVCPRRASKSFTAAKKALPLIIGRERKPDGTAFQPTMTWVVGPTYDLAEVEFMYLWEDLKVHLPKLGLPEPTISRTAKKGGDLYLLMPWGGQVVGKSADKPQSLLGKAVDCVILCEAAQMPEEVWTRYLMATLTTTKGYAFFPTTPDAGAKWLYDLWLQGLQGDDLVASWTWPITGNPAVDPAEVERYRKHYGEHHPYFREQYLGEWTFYSGTVFGQDFEPNRNLIEPYRVGPGARIIRSIDFGYRDPFVCKWYTITSDGGLDCYREYHQPQRDLYVHAQTIRELSRYDDGAPEETWYTVADRSEPQMIADLRRYGVPCIESDSDRRAGRLTMGEFLRTGRLRYMKGRCPETVKELARYRWAKDSDKEGAKEKTEGDDHCMDADRYACRSRPQPRRPIVREDPRSFDATRRRLTQARVSRLWPRALGVG